MILKSICHNKIFPVIAFSRKYRTNSTIVKLPVHHDIHPSAVELFKVCHNTPENILKAVMYGHFCFQFDQKHILFVFFYLVNNLISNALTIIYLTAVGTSTALPKDTLHGNIIMLRYLLSFPKVGKNIYTFSTDITPVLVYR